MQFRFGLLMRQRCGKVHRRVGFSLGLRSMKEQPGPRKPSASNANLADKVPVRPKPAPITDKLTHILRIAEFNKCQICMAGFASGVYLAAQMCAASKRRSTS